MNETMLDIVRDDTGAGRSSTAAARPRYVIMSGYHDYRSKRKANLHFIADELKLRGDTFFFSLRYSYLTRYKEDPRHALRDRANTLESVNGVHCYLWRTPLHPFRLPTRLRLIEKAAFKVFALRLPRVVQRIIDEADTIFVESGIAITFVPLVKRRNPMAKIIYMASDSLAAIGQAQAIKDCFARFAHLYDSARVPSPYLRDDVPAAIPCYHIPHGIDKKRFESIGPSPFAPGTRNAVSVGSMLFDPSFFDAARVMFPDVKFHIIGSGHDGSTAENVIYYGEMPFDQTLPYLKYSDFAVAPYGKGVEPYLSQTSMKLMQYDYIGVPAVCPEAACGASGSRFGYKIGEFSSIRDAITSALSAPHSGNNRHLTWKDVTARLLEPLDFADTKLTDPQIGRRD